MKSGIYTITNKLTGRVYVGKATNLKYRIGIHYVHAHSPTVPNYNYELERDIRIYGEDNFIEEEYNCPVEIMDMLEALVIKTLTSLNIQLYNKHNNRKGLKYANIKI